VNLLTKEDLSAKLRVSKRTVENWVASGEMPPPAHIGRRAYWPEEKIESWLRQKTELQAVDTKPSPEIKARRRGRPRKSDAARFAQRGCK
jgi:excisionase family DNA binding protein